jgi:hypothetical protein
MAQITYVGPRKDMFSVVGPSTGQHYTVPIGQPFEVDAADADALLTQYGDLFVRVHHTHHDTLEED